MTMLTATQLMKFKFSLETGDTEAVLSDMGVAWILQSDLTTSDGVFFDEVNRFLSLHNLDQQMIFELFRILQLYLYGDPVRNKIIELRVEELSRCIASSSFDVSL